MKILRIMVIASLAAITAWAATVTPVYSLYGIGLVVGLFGVQLLWWQVALGNRWLSRFFTNDLVSVNKLHAFLGKYGFLLVAIHPIAMLSVYGLPPSYPGGLAYVFLGIVAFDIFAAIWLASALLRKKLSWDWWKRIHWGAYAVLLLIFIHSANLQVILAQNRALEVWWAALGLSFAGMAIVRFARWAGYLKGAYKLVEKQQVSLNTYKYKLQHVSGKKLQPNKGQFAYLQTKRFKQQHPFTVSFYDEETGDITFTIKQIGDFTDRLPQAIETDDTLYVDGPYGVFASDIDKHRKPVVIAGGIGITPFLRWLHENADLQLIWGNQTVDDIAYKELTEQSQANITHVLSNQQAEGYHNGYVDEELLKKTLAEDLRNYNYYLCGPPPMMDVVQKVLSKNGVLPDQIRTERFSL